MRPEIKMADSDEHNSVFYFLKDEAFRCDQIPKRLDKNKAWIMIKN